MVYLISFKMGKKRFQFYVIKGGNRHGIYNSWSECNKALKGQKGGTLKGFYTKREAEEFILVKPKKFCEAVAFTSGAYNIHTEHYSWCGIIVFNHKKHIIKGSNNDLNLVKSWSIAGKVKAVEETIKKALELNIKSMRIYQDLELIEKLHSEEYKPTAPISERLVNFFNSIKDKLDIQFEHKSKLDDNPLVKEAYNTARDFAGLNTIK